MSLNIVFWVLFIIAVCYWLWGNWNTIRTDWKPSGVVFFLLVLDLILGWAVFGAVVKG